MKNPTITDFGKTVKIYRSHKLKNDSISITYAYIIDNSTVSESKIIETENAGGALKSLYAVKVQGQHAQSPIKDFNTGKIIGYN